MPTWTYQAQLGTAFGGGYDVKSAGGTTLAAHFGIVYRSTDGGVTWVTGSSFGGIADNFAILGGGKWAITNNDGVSFIDVSIDDGITWVSRGAGVGYAIGPCAGDGAGRGIFVSATVGANGAWTTDGGTTFTTSTSWPFAQPLFSGCLLWDGSHFIAVVKTNANSANGDIYTAPSGFSQGAGPTWTHVGSFTNYLCFQGTSASSAALSYDPSVGYVAMSNSNPSLGSGDPGIMFASSVAGLLTATAVIPPPWVGAGMLGSATARAVLATVNNTVIAALNSPTPPTGVDTEDGGVTWTTDDFSFPSGGFHYATAICYDSVSGQAIALSATGAISTLFIAAVVPNVVGDTLTVGEAAIVAAGLTVGTVSSTPSGTIPAGIIISTSPVAGTVLSPGAAVNILQSSGPQVPNCIGDTQAGALAAITAAGLSLGPITYEYSGTVAVGIVFGQEPVAGSSAAIGSPVSLDISLGPNTVAVPNVVGLTEGAASGVLLAAGFIVGSITAVTDSTQPVGFVATQSPVGGSLALRGSAVDLGVSFVVPEFDVDATVISQYANSPTLITLVENFAAYFDPAVNIQQFYLTVWNIDTASGFGLDIWGLILGVSRIIPIPGGSGAFGFNNDDVPPDWENFGNENNSTVGGPFYTGALSTGSYRLDDGPYRVLLLTKALANICATTAQALNALIQNLFPGRGRCYTQDLGGMAMSYVFNFSLSTIEYAILAYSGVIAHPAGVKVNISVVPAGAFFGFEEAGSSARPFDFGVFYNGG
jgi:beta-lactam-binding protein with PASTA domain